MPGFGRNPFGKSGFGAYDWTRTVLYRSLPALHQRQDAEQGYPLAKLVEGERPSFESLRKKIEAFGTLRDPLLVRTQYNDNLVVTLGQRVITKGAVLQRGSTGTITGFGEFIAQTARFNPNHVGKDLVITRSANPANNTTVTIAQVSATTPTIALIAPPLNIDAGPLTWELREPSSEPANETIVDVEFGDVSKVVPGWFLFDGSSDFEVMGRTQLTGTTEREGTDGALLSGQLMLSLNQLTLEDIGKRITIFNSEIESNNDTFEITNVVKKVPTSPLPLYQVATLRRIGPSDYFDAGDPIVDDAGPFEWAILPRPKLTLRGGRQRPLGLVEQLGFDAEFDEFITSTTLASVFIGISFAPGTGYVFPENASTVSAVVTSPIPAGSGDIELSVTYTNELGTAGRTGTVTVADGALLGDAFTLVLDPLDFGVRSIQAVVETTPGLGTGLGLDFVGVPIPSVAINIPSADFIPDIGGSEARVLSVVDDLATVIGLSGVDSTAVGQRLRVSGALDAGNNSDNAGFEIVQVVDSTRVVCINPNAVPDSAYPPPYAGFNWAIYSSDRNKLLTLRGPGSNNGSVLVLSVAIDRVIVAQRTPTPFVYDGLAPNTFIGPLEWELRKPATFTITDRTAVQLRPPSLLQYLAKDFGVEIDLREIEPRQRSWVRNNSQWIGIKGTAKSYELLGDISGFDVSAEALYRITPELALLVPPSAYHEVGEYADGRSAPSPSYPLLQDGELQPPVGGKVKFFAPSATFNPATDVGLQIRILGSSQPSNNKLYTIDEVIPEPSIPGGYSVLFKTTDSAITPDTNLQWRIVRLYTTYPPLVVRNDEINAGLMEQTINPKASLYMPGNDSLGDLLYTAKAAGIGGNSIQVAHVPGAALAIAVVGTAITVTYVPGVTTANNVVNAILIDPLADALVSAAAVSTGLGFLRPIGSTFLNGGANNFGVDKFCWEVDFDSTIPSSLLVLNSVNLVAENLWKLSISGPMNVVQGVSGSNWRLTDETTGIDYYLESVPVFVSGNWETTVYAAIPPTALDAISLTYDCVNLTTQPDAAPELLCDYCPASRVLITVQSNLPPSTTALELELVLNRIFDRIKQVTPAHVQPVYLFVISLEASLSPTAEITEIISTGAMLIAPVEARYDSVPGDEIPADSMVIYALAESFYPGTTLASVTSLVGTEATVSGFPGPIPNVIGSTITISGAASAANNGTFPITNYTSGPLLSTVSYTNAAAVTPDANDGAITASINL